MLGILLGPRITLARYDVAWYFVQCLSAVPHAVKRRAGGQVVQD
jgi:hypothetical protein